MGTGGDQYGASLAVATSSGASNSGATSSSGGGGTKYQIIDGGGLTTGLASLTPKQLIPIVIGVVTACALIFGLLWIFRRK